MSDLFQDKKGDLTGDGLRGLAKLIAGKLPEDAVVVAASVGLRYDAGADALVMGENIEMASASNHEHGALAVLAVRMEERIHNAIDEMMDSEDWSFDTKKYPVLVFSVESDCDYYMLVAVAVDVDEPVEIDEIELVGEIIRYIDDGAPGSDWIEEGEPSVCYAYGVLTDPDNIYSLDFDVE